MKARPTASWPPRCGPRNAPQIFQIPGAQLALPRASAELERLWPICRWRSLPPESLGWSTVLAGQEEDEVNRLRGQDRARSCPLLPSLHRPTGDSCPTTPWGPGGRQGAHEADPKRDSEEICAGKRHSGCRSSIAYCVSPLPLGGAGVRVRKHPFPTTFSTTSVNFEKVRQMPSNSYGVCSAIVGLPTKNSGVSIL